MSSQKEADQIFSEFEEVRSFGCVLFCCLLKASHALSSLSMASHSTLLLR